MYRVFVFPTSNEPGLEIIQALRKSNKIQLYGGSSGDTTFDPARLALKNYIKCPWFDDDDFQEKFNSILIHKKIDLVFPAWDTLITQLSLTKSLPCKVVAPNADTAQLVLSKSKVYACLAGIVPVPEIYETDKNLKYPAFAKPDVGSGSKDIFLLESAEDLNNARKRNLLVCEYLPGEEYTVDCFNDMDGNVLVSSVRHRGKIGRGIALGTQIIKRPDITELCNAISKAIKIEGPWFAQFKENANGDPVLLEVNARVAGSMCLTRHAGLNIPLMSVFQFMGNSMRISKAASVGVMNRSLGHSMEPVEYKCVIWDLDDTLIRKDGLPDPEAVAHLMDCHNRGKLQLLLTKNNKANVLLSELKIPHFFEEVYIEPDDKCGALSKIFLQHGLGEQECIIVNDSYEERFRIEAGHPTLKVIMPDALECLGWEKIH